MRILNFFFEDGTSESFENHTIASIEYINKIYKGKEVYTKNRDLKTVLNIEEVK